MPCIGNHEAELDNGPYGYNSYNTRYMLPGNGTSFPGSFYSFQLGTVLFISLDANDVCYQGAGAYNVGFVATTDPEHNAIRDHRRRVQPVLHGHLHPERRRDAQPRRYDAQRTDAVAGTDPDAPRADVSIDRIVVQMHQCAMSSSTDNGSDAGIRQAWLPLFAKYQVNLVLNGHDHDYILAVRPRHQTSTKPRTSTLHLRTGGWTPRRPTRGHDSHRTSVKDETSPFNTSEGTVFMVLSGGINKGWTT